MATLWLIYGIVSLAMEAFGAYSLSKTGGGAVEYTYVAIGMATSLALVYGAIVEGMTLAYIIIALGLYYTIRSIYYTVTGSGLGRGAGVIGIAVGLLILYWGWQRYSAASMMIPMMGGRRLRRR
jgi:hypothetical protein